MIDVPIYRNERRTIVWGTGEDDAARPGHVVIDPPEHVADRYADQFARIDEEGHVSKYDLENMRLADARRIAEIAETDAVGRRSPRSEIVEALSPPSVPDSETEAETEAETAQAESDTDVDENEGESDGDDEGRGDESDESDGNDHDENAWQALEDETGRSTEDLAAEEVTRME